MFRYILLLFKSSGFYGFSLTFCYADFRHSTLTLRSVPGRGVGAAWLCFWGAPMPRAGCVHSSACAATWAVLLFAPPAFPYSPIFCPSRSRSGSPLPCILPSFASPCWFLHFLNSFSPLEFELLIEAVKKVQEGWCNDERWARESGCIGSSPSSANYWLHDLQQIHSLLYATVSPSINIKWE